MWNVGSLRLLIERYAHNGNVRHYGSYIYRRRNRRILEYINKKVL